MKPQSSLSERFYARLVRLYPREFRDEFGSEMGALFADQYAQARSSGRSRIGGLWLRTLGDLSCSLIRQHLDQGKGHMNRDAMLKYCSRKFTFSRLFAGLALLLMGLCALVTLFALPQVYQGQARIVVPTPEGSYDPYQVQVVFEKIQSRQVLEPVIRDLKLTSALASEAGVKGELTMTETYQNLRRRLQLRQHRNTGVVRVTVYSENRELSANIANSIVKVAMRTPGITLHPAGVGATAGISWIEEAVPESRPVRPNIPLNLVAGSLLSSAVAVIVAMLMRWLLKAASPA